MTLPTFHNDDAHAAIGIGVLAFHCMGTLPPHDHPHVALTIEDASVACPYCGTVYYYDARLGPIETDPPGCAYGIT